MTPEELLIPRYKVISDWPDNAKRTVGEIITSESESHSKYFETYPVLFKKLEWWEDRKPEDMPAYVRCIRTPDQNIMPDMVLKTPDWNTTWVKGSIGQTKHFVVVNTNCFVPATEEEYNNYLSTLK